MIAVTPAPPAPVRTTIGKETTDIAVFREKFRADVIEGLQCPEKRISSRYFYDATGDRLFQQIMASPDYYVTRSEAEIFRTQNSALSRALADDVKVFDVVELGSGDGIKTQRLLRKWLSRGQRPVYQPIDISANSLQKLTDDLRSKFPELTLRPRHGDYNELLQQEDEQISAHKVFLFLGSNIGNLQRSGAVILLRKIAARMSGDDRLLVGFDLKKDPRIICRAYNDRAGITRQFNLNLLHRINNELEGDLHIDMFAHEPMYDPQEGRAMSFLVSKAEQWVRIPGASQPFHFKAWESIHTETSHKYDQELITSLAQDAGLRTINSFTDRKGYFADVVFGLK